LSLRRDQKRKQVGLGIAGLLLAVAGWSFIPIGSAAKAPQDEYSAWIAEFADRAHPEAIVTVTRVSPGLISRYFVLPSGKTLSERFSDRGSSGGDGERLREILATLPQDTGTLPPPERRTLLQFFVKGVRVARVYDRAHLTDAILETKLVSSWVPAFQPIARLELGPLELNGDLIAFPDGKTLLSALSFQPIRVIDTDQRQIVAEHSNRGTSRDLDIRAEKLMLAPDAGLLVVQSYSACEVIDPVSWKRLKTIEGAFDPQFTRDGKFLLHRSTGGTLQAVDTKTLNTVALPSYIPSDGIAYIAGPKLAVAQLKNTEIVLWNPDERRSVAVLAKEAQVWTNKFALNDWKASFSPNEKSVAVAYLPAASDQRYKITVFNVADGKKLHELLFADTAMPERSMGLDWTPDGRYLIAASEDRLGMWDVHSGRYAGEFRTGQSVQGFVRVTNSQIAVQISAGSIQWFDLSAALKDVAALN
jgi:hypothetical protein